MLDRGREGGLIDRSARVFEVLLNVRAEAIGAACRGKSNCSGSGDCTHSSSIVNTESHRNCSSIAQAVVMSSYELKSVVQ